MTWRTHPLVVGLRSVARSLGLTRLLKRAGSSGYEAAFQDAMFSLVRPGDVVWDVGANVGLYAAQFAERTGAGGRVFAFEPGPSNLEMLRRNLGAHANATILGVALGDREGDAAFEAGSDRLGATGRIVTGESAVRVRMTTGDGAVASGMAAQPQVVKIDTEGFEAEVVDGMPAVIADPRLRALCIEVHFGILEERGKRGAPARIEKLLASNGYRVSWPDASHLIAARPAP